MASDALRVLLQLLTESSEVSHHGLRVVRGPDWKWGDQDGGAGGVGTVEKSKSSETVSVIWDCGHQNSYRVGAEGKFDLRVVSNAPAGVYHKTVSCDECKQFPVKGIRWKCKACENFDLCSACYHGGKHDLSHPFLRVEHNNGTGVAVSPRVDEVATLTLRGVFPGATVQRGEDWKWSDQDGGRGRTGKVLKIADDTEPAISYESFAVVRWREEDTTLYRYRMGHKGYVDLKTSEAADGGRCYVNHLPVLKTLERPSAASDADQTRRGLRVVRGPDWSWADQDGGAGHVGTVENFRSDGKAQVRWDDGNANLYYIGKDGDYDLRVLDSAPIGVEHRVKCVGCDEQRIKGFRWRCKQCPDVSLCSACYGAPKHSVSHQFYRHDRPTSQGVLVSPRKDETPLKMLGSFPGAVVTRGVDWKWGDQDGGEGKTGTILGFAPPQAKRPARSWVSVEWSKGFMGIGRRANVYRLCYRGLIDVKCEKEAAGGAYYANHLPVLRQELDKDPVTPAAEEAAVPADDDDAGSVPVYITSPGEEGAAYAEFPDCYFQGLSGKETEKRLKAAGVADGTYLLRDSEGLPGTFALSVRDQGKVVHYRIKRQGNSFEVCNTPFASLTQLVQHFSKPGRPTIPLLRQPLRPEPSDVIYADSNRSIDAWEVDKGAVKKLKYLGSGSFGDVHMGEWQGEKVAMKSLKAGAMKPSDFLREADRMKRMHHPNIVELYAVCTRGDPFLIIMEYLENGSLNDYLKGRSEVHAADMRRLAGNVASGMEYLESRNIVHRDLAGRNVLVGANGVAKVADFGMSALLKSAEDVYSAQNKLMFPVRWTAPEAIRSGQYTSKSDVWSFSILLFEITTRGRGIPYREWPNNDVVMKKVLAGYRMEKPADCPADLWRLMTQCWRGQPADRPSFADLRAALCGSAAASPASQAAAADDRQRAARRSELIESVRYE